MSFTVTWTTGQHFVLKPWVIQPTTAGDLTGRIVDRIRSRLFLGFVAGVTKPCAIKVAQGSTNIVNLENEVQFYDKELAGLQGNLVPRIFGAFKGPVEGVETACLIMEYCAIVMEADLHEYNRKVMLAACKLHAAGVNHGNLLASHHIIPTADGLRLVDFSEAKKHRCLGALPQVRNFGSGAQPSGCAELDCMEAAYGQFSDEGMSDATRYRTFGRL